MNYCVKCGAVDKIQTKYQCDLVLTAEEDYQINKKEYLEKRCIVCGYIWSEPCADAQTKKIQHILD